MNAKKVKVYYALFSKISRKLFIVKGDPYNYSPEILVNNIDGGFSVWPYPYMIGSNGEIMVSLKGSELKEHVNSKLFINSKAPINKKNELKRFTQSISNSDDILMIVK